jgi:sporulation protein YlmC with PRC-barrel domain
MLMLRRELVIAGLVMAGSGGALAQPAPPTTAPPPTTPGRNPTTAPLGDLFVSPAALDAMWRSSDLAGRAVYNVQDEKIGTVQEILFEADGRIAAIVIGMGGVLGLGKKTVAVAYRAFRLTRDDDGSTKVTLDIARTTLEAAPDYTPAKGRNPG